MSSPWNRYQPTVRKPTDIANLVAWFEIVPGNVWSDTGGTVDAYVGGSVRSFGDRKTGALVTLNQAASFIRTSFGTYAIDVPTGTVGTITGLTGLSGSDSDWFVGVACAKNTTTGVQMIMCSSVAVAHASFWYLGVNAPWLFYRNGLATYGSETTVVDANGSVAYGLWQNSKSRLGINTWHETGSTATASGAVTSGVCLFAAPDATYPFVGKFFGGVIAASTTQDERDLLVDYLRSIHGTCRIVCEGNSLTSGYSGEVSYPEPLQTLLTTEYGSGAVLVRNMATVGYLTKDLITRFHASTRPYLGVGRSITVLMSTPTNGLYTPTYTPRVEVDQLWSLCRQIRQAGSKVIVSTTLPTQGTGVDTAFAFTSQLANRLIREEWPSNADGFFDIANDERFMNPNNSTYYQVDKIHIKTAAGEVIAEEMVLPEIKRILSEPWMPFESGDIDGSAEKEADAEERYTALYDRVTELAKKVK